jgi:hypothetical protein
VHSSILVIPRRDLATLLFGLPNQIFVWRYLSTEFVHLPNQVSLIQESTFAVTAPFGGGTGCPTESPNKAKFAATLAISNLELSPGLVGWERVILPMVALARSLIALMQSRTVLITIRGFPRTEGGVLKQKNYSPMTRLEARNFPAAGGNGNSNIDYSIENLVRAENPKHIVCLLYQAIFHKQTNKQTCCLL